MKSTERARFEQLAMPHMDAAYNLALHLVRTRADAEDAVQDAFVRAFRAFHQLEGQSTKPWLLTIVRNVCYRHLQNRRRAANVVSLDEALLSPDGGREQELMLASHEHSPEQSAIASSEQALLREALQALPAAFREVIILRELEDLSYREIADVIGAPVGTVMSRLSRARDELQRVYNGLLARKDKDAL
jgi:RNA polymerase sigma-70 factor (ECF subfamily)